MNKSIFLVVAAFIFKTAFAQTDTLKTISRYCFHEASGPTMYMINGKEKEVPSVCRFDHYLVSRKTYNKIMDADSVYDNLEGLHFVLFKNPKGRLLYSYYSFGADKGEPYGEYNEYYPNGRLKIKGYYKMPAPDVRSGVADGTWYYYTRHGRLIGTKQYRDGLADGAWMTYNKKGKLLAKKYFSKGFASGTWSMSRYYTSSLSGTWYYNFYKGFYQGTSYDRQQFVSLLDSEDNIKTYDETIEVEKIEYSSPEFYSYKDSDKATYIVKGKFYEVKDGIIRSYYEFRDGELVKKIDYEH